MRGYYALIQYCPEPSRAEGANVGVVLYCPEAKFLDVQMSLDNDHARRLFTGATFDSERLSAAKSAFANRLKQVGQEFRSVEDLEQFMRTRGNALQLVPPRPVRVDEPAASLKQLFAELVGGRSRADAH